MSVNWGILSTARINRKFLPGARAAADTEVVAVAGRERAAAEAFAGEHGIPRAYGSYEQLLADPEIDAVYIPLPNSLHVEWTERALKAGKHVLCEKPFSRRAEEAERAFALAESQDRLLMEAFMYRHNPQTDELVRLLEAGTIGQLRMITASFGFNLGGGPNVRLDPALDGGALMDVGCYCVNAIRLIAGEPESLGAQQVVGGGGVDVAFAATLRMPDGVLAHFDAGMNLAPRHHLELVGEHGVLRVDDPWHCVDPGITIRIDEGVRTVTPPAADSYALQAENFSRAILGHEAPRLGRADAIGQARAIEALYAAAQA